MSENGSITLMKMPRTIEEVRQLLLASIPAHLGEYRVFEGKQLSPPMSVTPPPPNFERLREVLYQKLCDETRSYRTFLDEYCFDMMDTLAATDEHLHEFWHEEKQAFEASHEKLLEVENELIEYDNLNNPFGVRIARQKPHPIYIIALKKPYGVIQIPSDDKDVAAWGVFHCNFKFPDAYLKAMPHPSHLDDEELRIQGLGNLGLTPRVFWRRTPGGPVEHKYLNVSRGQENGDTFNVNIDASHAKDNLKSTNQEKSIIESYQANDEEPNCQITDDDHEIHPAVDEPSSDEDFQNYEYDGDYSDVEVAVQQDSADERINKRIETHESSSSSSDDEEVKYRLAKLKRRFPAPHKPFVQDRVYNDDRFSVNRDLSSRYTWAGKTPRRSSSLPPSESSESEEDQQSDFEPTISKKRKLPTVKGNTAKPKPKPKPKPKAKAPARRRRSKVYNPAPQQESDLESDDEDLIPYAPKRTRKSVPEPKASSQSGSDEDEDCIASPPKRARKSLPEPKASSQSDDDLATNVDEDIYKPSPRKGRKSLPKSMAMAQSEDELDSDLNEDDVYKPSPRKRARKSLPEPKASSKHNSDGFDSDVDDDDMPPPKRARKSVQQTKRVSQEISNDSDVDVFHYPSPQHDFPFNCEAECESSSPPPKEVQRKSNPKPTTDLDVPLVPGNWTQREHNAAEAIIRARRALEASNPELPRFRDERLYKHVSHELSLVDIQRDHGPCKNYWNRYGRTRSGFEERYGKAAGASLVTSAQKPKGTAKPRVKKDKKNKKDPKPKRK